MPSLSFHYRSHLLCTRWTSNILAQLSYVSALELKFGASVHKVIGLRVTPADKRMTETGYGCQPLVAAEICYREDTSRRDSRPNCRESPERHATPIVVRRKGSNKEHLLWFSASLSSTLDPTATRVERICGFIDLNMWHHSPVYDNCSYSRVTGAKFIWTDLNILFVFFSQGQCEVRSWQKAG